MDPSIDRAAPFPGEGFKRGFVMMVYSPKFFGGAAEFASASIHLSNAIKDRLRAVRGGQGAEPRQAAGGHLLGLPADEGSVRHELPADLDHRAVGRPSRRLAERQSRRGR